MPKNSSNRKTNSSARKSSSSARKANGSARKMNGSAKKTNGSAIKATNVAAQDKKYLEQYANKLSPTTKRAKWINSPNENEDRAGQSLATRKHEVIQHWAEERRAVPATVPSTRHGNDLGVLRFDFQGYGGGRLQKVNWEDWFRTFDNRKLTFVFQEHKRDGNMSNFFRLDSPLRENG